MKGVPYSYALQIAGVALAMGLIVLGGVAFASWQFDRNARKIEARETER